MNRTIAVKSFQRNEAGLTLIELIVALLIIGISAATISALVVNGFNFVRFNEKFGQDMRAAESCYETILALHEADKWIRNPGDNQQAPWDRCTPCDDNGSNTDCPANWKNDIFAAQKFDINRWVNAADVDIFRNGCYVDEAPDFDCRGVSVDSKPATQFRIPIRGSNNLELVIPIDEPVGAAP